MKKFILLLFIAMFATSCTIFSDEVDAKYIVDNTHLGMKKETVLSLSGEPWYVRYDYDKTWGNFEHYYYHGTDFNQKVRITF